MVANSPIINPETNTIALSAPIWNKPAYVTSVSHSQANQGAPGRENENKSRVGTLCCSRMYWPVRMCHPVSPSPSNDIQPLAPEMNSHTISAIKKQSETDGVAIRARPRTAAAPKIPACPLPMDSGGCVEVAKVTPIRAGPLVPWKVIVPRSHLH